MNTQEQLNTICIFCLKEVSPLHLLGDYEIKDHGEFRAFICEDCRREHRIGTGDRHGLMAALVAPPAKIVELIKANSESQ